jgi:hypothetical protein
MNKTLALGTNFIWQNARLLERAIYALHFQNGSEQHILRILLSYQNEDGGFGNALEPDLRAPDSQPLFMEFALRTLYDCKIRDTELVYHACDYLSNHADLKQGIPMVFPSSQLYPKAPHMDAPSVYEPSLDRLTSLVGLATWQGVYHPWLQGAIEVCLDDLSKTRYTDAHTIMNAFCLIESLSPERNVDQLFEKLTNELFAADYYRAEVPVKSYGLTPLAFAPSPDSYCRSIFTDRQIDDHLNELESQQEEDGGWPILWEPPGEMARGEWRAYKTVMALITLKAYGRI